MEQNKEKILFQIRDALLHNNSPLNILEMADLLIAKNAKELMKKIKKICQKIRQIINTSHLQ